MPRITDPPPGAVREDLDLLEPALDEAVLPRVLDRRLLIGTWNPRHFGGLTEEWESSEEDSPRRDLQSILTIAGVARRFDVVALREVRGDLKALRHTLEALGDDWGLILSAVTRGARGDDERLGFLFDRRTVQPSGLVGELVVPAEELRRIARAPSGGSSPGRPTPTRSGAAGRRSSSSRCTCSGVVRPRSGPPNSGPSPSGSTSGPAR